MNILFQMNRTARFQMNRTARWVLVAIVFASISVAPKPGTSGESALPIFGYLEEALLLPQMFRMKAKLDSGADNSSIHATNIQITERDGKEWIGFEVESIDGRDLRIEQPVLRWVRVKRHSGQSQRRPVIKLTICVGAIAREVQVNLVDRAKLKYNLLVGRSFMSGRLLVDPARSFTTPPTCKGNAPQ